MRNWRSWLAVFGSLLLLVPLGLLCLSESTRLDSRGGVSPPLSFSSLVASILVASAAAALAVGIGTVLAGLFSLTRFPFSAGWTTLALLPFLCPPTVWALMQVYAYGPGGVGELLWGDAWRPALTRLNHGHYLSTTLVLAQIHVPVALLIVGRGIERLAFGGLEAAHFYLPPGRFVSWLVTALRRELVAAFLIALALGLGNFAVPHVLQCRLFVIDVYSRSANYLDPAGAMRAAGILLLVVLLAGILAAVSERPAARAAAKAAAESPRRWRIPLGRALWPLTGLLLLYFAATTGLPLFALLRELKSPPLFFEAVRAAAPETANSLRIGLAAATVAAAIGLAMAILIGRATRGSAADAIITASLGVPALLTGLAVSRLAHRGWPFDLSFLGSTSLLVMLALGLRGWPFAARLLAEGRRGLSPAWFEAARLGELRGVRRWRWLDLPLLLPDLAAAALLVFVFSIGDVEISQLLCPPGGGTLALRLFTFLHFGPAHVTASLAMLQLLLAVVPVLVYFLLADRWLRIL